MKTKSKNYNFKSYLNILYLISVYFLSFGRAKHIKMQRSNNLRLNSELDGEIRNINNEIIFGGTNYVYITSSVDEEGHLFVESSCNDKDKKRYIASLDNKGRAYFNELIQIFTFDKDIKRKTGNSIVFKRNNKKYLLSISYEDYFELIDLSSLDSSNNLYKESKAIEPYLINSNINSLFILNDNLFFFLY